MEKKFRILITSNSFAKTDPIPLQMLNELGCEIIENPYGRPLKEAELIPLLTDVDGVIAGLDEFSGKVMKRASRLKVISRYGVGIDNIDLKTAQELGIKVRNTPDANTQAVADLTFGLILAVSRRIPQSHQSTREGKWERLFGRGVYGKSLGIIGLGRIGKAVAQRAKGFDMEVSVYDVMVNEAYVQAHGIRLLPLDDLLGWSDFISIHCDLNPSTKGLIGSRELGLMKKTAYLINTARGGIIDEQALNEALHQGQIAGAGLDAFVQEPPLGSPLLTLESIVTTSHIGAYTYEAVLEMGITSVKNLIEALKEKFP